MIEKFHNLEVTKSAFDYVTYIRKLTPPKMNQQEHRGRLVEMKFPLLRCFSRKMNEPSESFNID